MGKTFVAAPKHGVVPLHHIRPDWQQTVLKVLDLVRHKKVIVVYHEQGDPLFSLYRLSRNKLQGALKGPRLASD